MSNNIAEGSGSISKKEFTQFLNIARRSTFENANILILLQSRNFITQEAMDQLLDDLDMLCRQITNFQKTLNNLCIGVYILYALCSRPSAFRHALRSALCAMRLAFLPLNVEP
jgi:hypothetical protein